MQPALVQFTIEVVDELGRPASNAFVSVSKSSVQVPETAYVTNSFGQVRFFLPEGHYTFEGVHNDCIRGEVSAQTRSSSLRSYFARIILQARHLGS